MAVWQSQRGAVICAVSAVTPRARAARSGLVRSEIVSNSANAAKIPKPTALAVVVSIAPRIMPDFQATALIERVDEPLNVRSRPSRSVSQTTRVLQAAALHTAASRGRYLPPDARSSSTRGSTPTARHPVGTAPGTITF